MTPVVLAFLEQARRTIDRPIDNISAKAFLPRCFAGSMQLPPGRVTGIAFWQYRSAYFKTEKPNARR